MYDIYVQPDGSCECHIAEQGGTEKFVEPNLEAAIKAVIRGAKAWNNSVISREDIDIYDPRTESRIVWVKRKRK